MKNPYMQFFPGDWRQDACLSMCSPATRGVWIDWICAMHDMGRAGILVGTSQQLATLGRCSLHEIDAVLTELSHTKTAEIEKRNGVVTVKNRRMMREDDKRKVNADRQLRFRHKGSPDVVQENNAPSNAFVTHEITPMSQGGEVPPYRDRDSNRGGEVVVKGGAGGAGLHIREQVEALWQAYPKKVSRRNALYEIERALRQVASREPPAIPNAFEWLLGRVHLYAASNAGLSGRFTPNPGKWFDEERYDDDERQWNNDGAQNGNGHKTPADERRAVKASREYPEDLTL